MKPKVTIVYQPHDSCHLYPYFLATWTTGKYIGLYFNVNGDAVACGPVSPIAKWTIRTKGGMPKLDTPILSDEDVEDLND